MIPDLKAEFEKWDSESHKFELIEKKLSAYRDVHAYLLLERLAARRPDECRFQMVCAANHDQIWLDTNPVALAKAASPEDIRDLVRCGVSYDYRQDAFCFYV